MYIEAPLVSFRSTGLYTYSIVYYTVVFQCVQSCNGLVVALCTDEYLYRVQRKDCNIFDVTYVIIYSYDVILAHFVLDWGVAEVHVWCFVVVSVRISLIICQKETHNWIIPVLRSWIVLNPLVYCSVCRHKTWSWHTCH